MLIENLLGLIVFLEALLGFTFLRHFSLNLLYSLPNAIPVVVHTLIARSLVMQLQLSRLIRGRVVISPVSVLVHKLPLITSVILLAIKVHLTLLLPAVSLNVSIYKI